MAESIKITPVVRAATNAQKAEYITYYVFGALEILLAFRFVFKLAGASMTSGFVSFIYNLTRIFVLPFEGIFRRGFTQGVETTAVFEPATIVAMLVYGVLAWGIVKFVHISSGEQQVD